MILIHHYDSKSIVLLLKLLIYAEKHNSNIKQIKEQQALAKCGNPFIQ